MSAVNKPVLDKRVSAVLAVIRQLAQGRLDMEIAPSGRGDALDELIAGLAEVAEEMSLERVADDYVSETVRLSAERLKLAIDGAEDGLWDWDVQARRTYYSPRWKAMLGYADEEIGSEPGEWDRRLHPDDFDRVKEELNAHVAGRTPQYQSIYRMRHRNGHYIWVLARGRIYYGLDGKSLRVVGTHVDITERKRLEEELRAARGQLERRVEERTHELAAANEALRASEARWRSLVHHAPDIIITVDRNLDITFVNHMVPGGPVESYLGTSLLEYVELASVDRFRDAACAVFQRGVSVDIEDAGEWRCCPGTYFSSRMGPIVQDFVVVAATLILRDVSERLTMERALVESEQKYRNLWENLNDAAFTADAQSGAIIETNREGELLLGRPRQEIVGRHQGELHPVEQVEHYANLFKECAGAGRKVVYDAEVVRADGEVVPVDISASLIEVGGRPLMLGLFHDITERKQVERRLEFNQFALEHAADAIFWVGEELNFVNANEAACRSLGYTHEELLALRVPDVAPGFPDICRPSVARAMGQGTLTREAVHCHKDGHCFPVEVTANHFLYEGQDYICAIARDISERKAAEQALLERDANLQALTDNANDGILVTCNGRIVFANRRLTEMLGYTVDRLQALPLEALFEPPERGRVLPRFERRLAGDWVPDQYETVLLGRVGSSIAVELTAAETLWQGEPALIVIIRDIRVRKLIESRLRSNAERLSEKSARLQEANDELQRLIYVIAHDLKAPLRAVSHLATMIEEERGGRFDNAHPLHLLRTRVGRMHALIESLLAYSRIGHNASIERVDSGELIRDIVDSYPLPDGLVVDIGEGMPVLHTPALNLRQVLANLFDNAVVHHDRQGGRVSVTASERGEFYRFSVTDDGPGIPEPFQEKIFEMFQTLERRDAHERTGMGLALVRKMVTEVGGKVTVESALGQGTAFHVDWPKSAGPANT